MQHQLAGLRNRHKIADNALIRQRNRSAIGYLALKQRDNTACAAQHIAKARIAEDNTAAAGTVRSCDNLAHTLRRAHDIRGVDCLICGNHHKALRTIFLAQLNHIQRAKNIVFHCLNAVLFHQRHMLMRSSMHHDLRMVFLHNPAHGALVTDIGNLRLKIQLLAIKQAQLLLQVINAVLIYIQRHNLLRCHLRQLAAQLAADTATTTSYQNHLILIVIGNKFIIYHNRLAEQQFVNIKLTQHTLAALGNIRYGKVINLNLVACLTIEVKQKLLLRIHNIGDGKNNLLHAHFLKVVQGILAFRVNRQAHNLAPHLFLILVDKAHRHISSTVIAQQLVSQGSAKAPCAQHRHADTLVFIAALLDNRLTGKQHQKPAQEFPLLVLAHAITVAITIHQADTQSTQQVQHNDNQPVNALHMFQSGNILQWEVKQQRNQIRSEQAHIHANATIADYHMVNIAHDTANQQACKRYSHCYRKLSHILGFSAICAEQKADHHQKNQAIIKQKQPSYFYFFANFTNTHHKNISQTLSLKHIN